MVDELFEVFEDIFERRSKGKKLKNKKADKEGTPAPSPPAGTRPTAPLFCTSCGHRNEVDASFCGECGELLPSPGREMNCPRCELVVPLTAKFCSRCGARVALPA